MYLDELDTVRYKASHTELSGMNLYDTQRYYYTSGNHVISFDPLKWLVANLCVILNSEKCEVLYNKRTTPCAMLYEDMPIMYNYTITRAHKINITNIALSESSSKQEYEFDTIGYYNTYHEIIEHFWSYQSKEVTDMNEKTLVFYACYGFHKGLHLKPVEPLQYIASHSDLIASIGVDKEKGCLHFYTEGRKITFNPILYVASNWHLPQIREFVSCSGIVDTERATKHYIRHGNAEKLQVSSFNCWSYLANNHTRIQKILRRSSGTNRVEYEVLLLTNTVIAKDFIKKRGVARQNVFKPANFVKAYIDDFEWVNKDRALSLENAAEYFVKYYVLSERVRYEASWKYKAVMFFKARAMDSMRQIPYNATRYIVESRCI